MTQKQINEVIKYIENPLYYFENIPYQYSNYIIGKETVKRNILENLNRNIYTFLIRNSFMSKNAITNFFQNIALYYALFGGRNKKVLYLVGNPEDQTSFCRLIDILPEYMNVTYRFESGQCKSDNSQRDITSFRSPIVLSNDNTITVCADENPEIFMFEGYDYIVAENCNNNFPEIDKYDLTITNPNIRYVINQQENNINYKYNTLKTIFRHQWHYNNNLSK